jgi:hypothetical protein
MARLPQPHPSCFRGSSECTAQVQPGSNEPAHSGQSPADHIRQLERHVRPDALRLVDEVCQPDVHVAGRWWWSRDRGAPYPTTVVTSPGINRPTKNISATNTAAKSAHSGANSCFTEYPHSSTHMLYRWKGLAIRRTVLAELLRLWPDLYQLEVWPILG